MIINKIILSLFFTIFCCKLTVQDIYLHNPRGSNNRLNEKSATRENDNRVFDSQNNERGGYNIGDKTNQPFQSEIDQYQMKYFQSSQKSSSYLNIEWTSQHGCGEDNKLDCDIILQYLCQTKTDFAENDLDRLRDGITTKSQDYTKMTDENQAANIQRKKDNVKLDRAIEEPWEWYDSCNYRERNKGLFMADQNLKINEKGYSGAVYTRQNPNGDRSGYECPEERDYYPYFHPTLFKDIAILTSNISLCEYYTRESFNTKSKYLCVEIYPNTHNEKKHWSRWNNQNECIQNNGKWVEFFNYLEKATQFTDKKSCESSNLDAIWALPYDALNLEKNECLVMLPKPICQQADWTRSNHLGNTRNGEPAFFKWKLPYFPSNRLKKCALRIRYNITTDDYDPVTTDSKFNNQNSPVKNNPQINIGSKNQAITLAINTAQYGRVFQDRSHTFFLIPRTNDIPDGDIYNLNVRGKRGNIVQVYPGVEYDFVPNKLELSKSKNDMLHIQWTGSNTHNNGNPGGDGQTGDAGQGKTGTDRTNLAFLNDLNENFPLPYEISDFWKDVELVGIVTNKNTNLTDFSEFLKPINLIKTTDLSKDLALYFASSSYYQCAQSSTCYQSYDKMVALDSDLNNAPASMPGVIFKFTKSNKIYYYMSTRNNNFSNRSQKGTLIILN